MRFCSLLKGSKDQQAYLEVMPGGDCAKPCIYLRLLVQAIVKKTNTPYNDPSSWGVFAGNIVIQSVPLGNSQNFSIVSPLVLSLLHD